MSWNGLTGGALDSDTDSAEKTDQDLKYTVILTVEHRDKNRRVV